MAAHRRGSAAPPTRWEQTVTGDRWDFYAEKFERHVADGDDLEGEADSSTPWPREMPRSSMVAPAPGASLRP